MPASEDSHQFDAHIRRQLGQAIKLQLGSAVYAIEEEDWVPARERYAPMKRLLQEEDLLMLPVEERSKLRKIHGQCFLQFVSMLRCETRALRKARYLDHSDFAQLIREALLVESSLFYLSWLGWKFRFRWKINQNDLAWYLEFLFNPQAVLAGGAGQIP